MKGAESGAQAVAAPTATQIAMKVFKQKGFLGFYQGGTATLVRDVFFSSIYFPLFAYFNAKVGQIRTIKFLIFKQIFKEKINHKKRESWILKQISHHSIILLCRVF